MNRFKALVLAAAAAIPAASIVVAAAAGPNLITNGNFSNGVAGWDNFSGNPQPQNGAMAVTNNYQGTGNSYYSGWHCVGGIQAGTQYTVSTKAFVEAASPANTGAGIGLHYYASNDCSGSNLLTGGGLQYGGFTAGQRGLWITLGFNEVAPAGAHSVRVRATAVKHPNPSNSSIPGIHVVLFDDVYFGEATIATPAPVNTPTPPVTVTPVAGPGQDAPKDAPKGDVPPAPSDVATPIEEQTATPAPKPADNPGNGGGTNPGKQTTEPDSPKQEPEPVQPQTSTEDGSPLPPATGTGAAHSAMQAQMLLLVGAGTVFLGLVGGAFATRRRR
ncbi:MAG: hypothetical protein IT300_01080 [Dehalococcoidia bacterium]|nr:hypothetical protein [Dehalococcoidia bacterium]